ncbi:hypothetical protein K523DRAFT_396779, partial [Schizophyllum commune Tattone D]
DTYIFEYPDATTCILSPNGPRIHIISLYSSATRTGPSKVLPKPLRSLYHARLLSRPLLPPCPSVLAPRPGRDHTFSFTNPTHFSRPHTLCSYYYPFTNFQNPFPPIGQLNLITGVHSTLFQVHPHAQFRRRRYYILCPCTTMFLVAPFLAPAFTTSARFPHPRTTRLRRGGYAGVALDALEGAARKSSSGRTAPQRSVVRSVNGSCGAFEDCSADAYEDRTPHLGGSTRDLRSSTLLYSMHCNTPCRMTSVVNTYGWALREVIGAP